MASLAVGISSFARTTAEPNRLFLNDEAGGKRGYVIDRTSDITFGRVDGEVKAEVQIHSVEKDALKVSVTRTAACEAFRIDAPAIYRQHADHADGNGQLYGFPQPGTAIQPRLHRGRPHRTRTCGRRRLHAGHRRHRRIRSPGRRMPCKLHCPGHTSGRRPQGYRHPERSHHDLVHRGVRAQLRRKLILHSGRRKGTTWKSSTSSSDRCSDSPASPR